MGNAKADWTTISGDGALLERHWVLGDEEDVEGGILYVGDAKRTWLTSVDTPGAAINPKLAREGLHVCYEDPVVGGLHVGKLSLDSH